MLWESHRESFRRRERKPGLPPGQPTGNRPPMPLCPADLMEGSDMTTQTSIRPRPGILDIAPYVGGAATAQVAVPVQSC